MEKASQTPVIDKTSQTPVIEARKLKKWFPVGTGLFAKSGKEGNWVKAVDGVDLVVPQGHVVGIAGGSGAGKTALAMTMLRLYPPTEGSVIFEGQDITHAKNKDLTPLRRQAQIIFQDPYGSLNPRFTVARTIQEPLIVHKMTNNKAEMLAKVEEALHLVELTPVEQFMPRFPHQLSGGQRQRLCIARAMVLGARFLVADEPVSMLDVSIRAEVLTLLINLVKDFNLSVLFISHDIACMRYICNSINIMYRGRIVETGTPDQVIQKPLHPYTQALISAIPEMQVGMKRERVEIKSEALTSFHVPAGCRFRVLCPCAEDVCSKDDPELIEVENGHRAACLRFKV